MRRASSTLLLHLNRHKTITPQLPRNYISPISSSSSSFSPSHHRTPILRPCTKPHALLTKPKKFHTNPSQNLNALVGKPPQVSSRQKKIKERSEIEEAFESAKTTDEMLEAFKDMESAFAERELGLASLKLGLKLDQEAMALQLSSSSKRLMLMKAMDQV